MPDPDKPPKPESLRIHDTHLVCAIRTAIDGTRHSTCPVCAAPAVLPSVGGWLPVKCDSCGSEFVASDGSPPPAPPPPPPAPPPIRKPEPAASPPPPPPPLVVTEDILLEHTGSIAGAFSFGGPFVFCPLCHETKVYLPHSPFVRLTVDCPGCGREFIVKFPGAEKRPPKRKGRSLWRVVAAWCLNVMRKLLQALMETPPPPPPPSSLPPVPPPRASFWGRVAAWLVVVAVLGPFVLLLLLDLFHWLFGH